MVAGKFSSVIGKVRELNRKCEKMTKQEQYMKMAIDIAKTAMGHTSPNPMVGCVIVKDDKVIMKACHEKCGEFHAERNALTRCKEDVKGAELYVTLEPCCHYGKTPPCTEIIIEKGIKKVYVGSLDSNPLVSGHGIQILREHGIEVECGILEEDCIKMNEIFFHYIAKKIPFVAAKYAMTLDGKIAAYTGDSKWVTNEISRGHVQQLRKKYSGIMVGINTVLADNPMLNCRIAENVDPVRIILDSGIRIPMDCNIVNSAKNIRTIVAYSKDKINDDSDKLKLLHEKNIETIGTYGEKVNLNELILEIGKLGIDSVLIEGGGSVNAAAFEAGIVNKVYAYIAPKIIMGADAKSPIAGIGIPLMKNAIELKDVSVMSMGEDILVTGYVREKEEKCLQDL